MTEEMTNTRTLDVVAAEIRTFTASLLNNVIEIGRRLCEAKEMLPYGEFGAWVKENTAYSVSSANNFMRLFNEYGSAQGCLFGAETESQTFGKLSYSKALALLAVPAEEREEFVETHDVDAMSTRELAEAIRERDEAKNTAKELQGQLRAADAEHKRMVENIGKLQEQSALDAERRHELEKQIEELEARPVEVAVQQPDPAEIQKQIDAAVKEAKSAAAEEKKKLKDRLDAAEKAKQDLSDALEEQKKAAADKEKELIEQQAGVTSIEKERLEREIAALKKQLAMSDAAVITFNTLFSQAQDVLNRLMGAMAKAADEETAAKLRAAVRKLLDVYGEKVGA